MTIVRNVSSERRFLTVQKFENFYNDLANDFFFSILFQGRQNVKSRRSFVITLGPILFDDNK